MTDYALMNQLLFEGKHKVVKEMTESALASGTPATTVLQDGLVGRLTTEQPKDPGETV